MTQVLIFHDPNPTPFAMTHHLPLRAALALSLLVLLAGCDSGGDDGPDPQQTEFLVRYEVTGVCTGIRAIAYNVTSGGGVESGSGAFDLPWSFEHVVSAPTSPTATALAATCAPANEATHSLTARILVDGEVRAQQSVEGTNTLTVSLGVSLR